MITSLILMVTALQSPVDHGGIDEKALDHLVQRCTETKSWSLLVLHDGKTVVDRNFGHANPCNLMSATKSITGIAIGLLIDDGKLKPDTPVASIIPEYKGKWKDKVTIEHLLTHTSGIETYDKPGEDLTNRVSAAISAPVVAEPGTAFVYNNRAVDLLSGIVRRVTGKPLGVFLNERLFKPLGIRDYFWGADPDGNSHGCAELVLRPRDLAKIGQLFLQSGVWEGKRILSADFIQKATHRNAIAQPYPDVDAYGWLWWISDPWMTLSQPSIDGLGDYQVPANVIGRLQPLVGKRWPSISMMWGEMFAIAGPCPQLMRAAASGNQIQAIVKGSTGQDGYFANGWGGQYLLILPKQGLVAVRTMGSGFFDPKAPEKIDAGALTQYAKYEMPDFYRLVRDLVQEPSLAPVPKDHS